MTVTTARIQPIVRQAFGTIANTPPVIRLFEFPTVQKLAFSPKAQRLQGAVMALPQLNQILNLKPVKLASHYIEMFAAMAAPQETRHKIVMVGLQGKGGAFHLLRRHPQDDNEPGRLDNVTGHVHNGESFEDTMHREIGEETALQSEEMVRQRSATVRDLGHFGWLMHLRKPDGSHVPSIVYGKMFLFKADDIEGHHLKLDPKEHTEVVTMKTSEIARNLRQLCVFDQLFYNVNLPLLEGMAAANR